MEVACEDRADACLHQNLAYFGCIFNYIGRSDGGLSVEVLHKVVVHDSQHLFALLACLLRLLADPLQRFGFDAARSDAHILIRTL